LNQRGLILSSDQNHNDDVVVVDYALLVPLLYLSEALIPDYRLKKALVLMLDHVIKQKKPRIGKAGLLAWLQKTGFRHTDAIERLLKTTPLGNPVWHLFGSDPQLKEKLLADLDDFIDTTKSTEPRSLKSLMVDFIKLHPEYGTLPNYDETKWTTFFTFDYDWPLGNIVTRLMMLQLKATPKSKAQQWLDGIKNPSADKFPIHRPDYVLYGIALKDLLIGTAQVSKDAWDEMVSLYMSRTLTNFLAFAPLLLQPFVKSDLNIPAPTINTLATIMGDFTGATGTFMGDVTKANTEVRWSTLGLTIGKLCEKIGDMTPVMESTPNQEAELSLNLKNKHKVCGTTLSETPTLGSDRGWVVLGENLLEDRWNINLTDINDSLINDKIRFNKFPTRLIGTHVFNNPWALIRLTQWSRKQVKQRVVLLLLGDSGVWFNRLPSTQVLEKNVFSAFPILTSTFRSEKRDISSTRKMAAKAGVPVEPTSASRDEAKTDKFPSSEVMNLSMDVIEANSMRVDVDRPLLIETDSMRQDVLRPLLMGEHPDDDGISRFFIAETYQGDQYNKTCISKLRVALKPQLIRKRKEQEAYRILAMMTDSELKEEINRRIQILKFAPNRIAIVEARGNLEIAFAKLCERDIGITFSTLVEMPGVPTAPKPPLAWEVPTAPTTTEGVPTAPKPLHFRYCLGDEEATAVEAWYKEDPTTDGDPATPATLSVRRVRAALTFIYLLKYLKSQGEEWSYAKLWKFDIFHKYPLIEADRHAVFSLIPHLYWVYELKMPDHFRVKEPDMTTILFVPTARVSNFDILSDTCTDKDDVSCELDINKDSASSILPKELNDVHVSRLSFCSVSKWKPDSILESAANFFGINNYSHNLHPTKTQYVRLYVKLAVETLLKRLTNTNLAYYVSSISSTPNQMSYETVLSIFVSMKERLKTWYHEFVKSFNDTWRIIGNEWSMFKDLNEDEINIYYV
jgi:hypothetical protein